MINNIIKPRHFNEINIDNTKGILTKTSTDISKFNNEIKWYITLPKNINYCIPKILNYSLGNVPFISIEYYNYPSIHSLFINNRLSKNQWKKVFNRIKIVIDDMGNYYPDTYDYNKIIRSMQDMYIDKTINRLKIVEETLINSNKTIYINNVKYHSLKYYKEHITKLVTKLLLSDTNKQFNIIHGDLCFPNIIIDKNYNFIRLIDPRGSFGEYSIYGDTNYELAKILHSIEGKYDFIIEDMFDISTNEDSSNIYIDYKCNTDIDVIKEFKDVFNNIDFNKVRLIESLLFFSMIPLHSDYINRQYAMLSTAINLIEQINYD